MVNNRRSATVKLCCISLICFSIGLNIHLLHLIRQTTTYPVGEIFAGTHSAIETDLKLKPFSDREGMLPNTVPATTTTTATTSRSRSRDSRSRLLQQRSDRFKKGDPDVDVTDKKGHHINDHSASDSASQRLLTKASSTPSTPSLGEEVGTFNGYRLYYVNENEHEHGYDETDLDTSTKKFHKPNVHCVGDTLQQNMDTSWIFRSCEYKDNSLCYNMDTKRFFIRNYIENNGRKTISDSGATTVDVDATHTGTGHRLDDVFRKENTSKLPTGWYTSITASSFVRQRPRRTKDGAYITTKNDNDPYRDHPFMVKAIPSGGKIEPLRDKTSRPTKFYGGFDPSVTSQLSSPSSYFVINATLIPMYRYAIGFRNPGHHMWQEILSIYTLLDTFGYVNDNDTTTHESLAAPPLLLLFLRHQIEETYVRRGSIDMMNKMGRKFLFNSQASASFEMYNPYWEDGEFNITFTKPGYFNKQDSQSTTTSLPLLPTNIVCSTVGLTGVAQYGHHATHFQNGTHKSRNTLKRTIVPQNHGSRGGGFFRRFRSFMMKNVGVQDTGVQSHKRILFSLNSSTKSVRGSLTFISQIRYIQSKLNVRNYVSPQNHSSTSSTAILWEPASNDQVQIKGVTLHELSIEKQVQLISTTKILLTAVGGGSATSIFLPQGAHLILFYQNNFLDWDYWNNMSHIHVHWIPIDHAHNPKYLEPLFQLILECLHRKD